MIGTVLDVDSKTNTGILRGEDGHRYRFAGTEWKSSRRPANGDKVDFEPDAATKTAMTLYPMGGASDSNAIPPFEFSKMKDALSNVSLPKSGFGAAIFDDWRVLLAGLSIIACLLPYARVGLYVLVGPQSYNLFGFVATEGEVFNQFELLSGLTRVTYDANYRLTLVRIALNLTYLLYLIPLAAMVLLFRVFTRRPARTAAIVHGALSIFLPLFITIVLSSAVSVWKPSEFQKLGDLSISSFGFGAWVLIVLGIVQLAACLGFIKKSPRALVSRSA